MMDAVSNLDTNPEPTVKMITLDDILTNKANFYSVLPRDLKPLADSIAMDGLQQYPVVMPHPEQEGKYLLLSGHRRCAAIRLLVEDQGHPREDLRLVPCTVKRYRSEAMAELQLILANSTARVLTNAEISKQAERMEMLLYQLKEEGYEFPGRMRDQVAAACQVSAPKLARLKVIRENLKAPEFMYLFEKNKLPEQTAYALARLPEDFQKRLAGLGVDLTGNTAELILRKYEEGWRWEPDMQCPDGKACRRGDSFLRHDLGCFVSDMCGGKTCCLNCEQAKRSWSPCDWMCSKAQALRKEIRDDKKAEQERLARERTKAAQKETQANARRILRAAEAAGLSDEVKIPWDYYINRTVGEIRKFAAGEFPETANWSEAQLSPKKLVHSIDASKLLCCSTDYLLGLTDDLTPTAEPVREDAIPAEMVEMLLEEVSGQEIQPVWLSGTPEKSGPVAARLTIPGDNFTVVRLCWYNATAGIYTFSRDGAAIEAECTGWWPVPEKEDGNDDDQ